MRTTVTLDPDTEQIIQRRMRERGVGGVSVKEALDDAIRTGVSDSAARSPFRTETASMGDSVVNRRRITLGSFEGCSRM
ncbi:MAG: antitoxin [Acidimicrobiia bacterium]